MLNILFPKICIGCSELLVGREETLCASCRNALPLSCHHRRDDEAFKRIFYGRIPLQNATALLQFQKKGLTQLLLHKLKYKNQEKLSAFFGAWLGAELSEIPSYQNIDMVIPVPLHKKRLRKRGYNQVAGFGKEIAKALHTSYRDDILVKKRKNNSQVFKKRSMRFQATPVFSVVTTSELENKHILLVDDIVTTGATLENCAQQLLASPTTQLSVATMAIA
ncbi:ComF family protein [Flavobacteriaceae bacterium TK19130]|nr:ComF family protein [Thermobacterium salinum]